MPASAAVTSTATMGSVIRNGRSGYRACAVLGAYVASGGHEVWHGARINPATTLPRTSQGFLMRLPAAMLLVVVAGCGASRDRPEEVVRDYLASEDSAACRYLVPSQAKLCRRPHVPEPPANQIVIERVRTHGDRATIRASYDWTGYRRHSTFALVRREDDWLIVRVTSN
jgi:hypothetical protein